MRKWNSLRRYCSGSTSQKETTLTSSRTHHNYGRRFTHSPLVGAVATSFLMGAIRGVTVYRPFRAYGDASGDGSIFLAPLAHKAVLSV